MNVNKELMKLENSIATEERKKESLIDFNNKIVLFLRNVFY